MTEDRHMLYLRFAACLIALVASATLVGSVLAQSPPWPVKGKLIGGARDTGTDLKKSEDVSGIACASDTGFPRLCLIVDDESQGAQIVILKDGEILAGDYIRLITDVYEDKGRQKAAELDAEAVAYADGTFYVTGSHGRPRNTDDATAAADGKAAATRRIFQIKFPDGSIDLATGRLRGSPTILPSTKLATLLGTSLNTAFDAALKANGLTIEGLAVTERTLHVGMRGPVLPDGRDKNRDKAAILSMPLDSIFGEGSGQPTIVLLDLAKDSGEVRGIRDLVAYKGGFLIIAGPVLDPANGDAPIQAGDYAIYRHIAGQTTKLLDLPGYGAKVKPEALLPLDEANGTMRALLLFDGPDEGGGRTVTFKLP